MRRVLLRTFLVLVFMFIYSGKVHAADTTAPEIAKANILTTSTQKPGSIQIQFDVVETGMGISYIQVYMRHKDGLGTELKNYMNISYDTPIYSGTEIVTIPVPRAQAAGSYYIEKIWIEDGAGNKSIYRSAPMGYSENGEWVENDNIYIPDANGFYLAKCNTDDSDVVIDNNTEKCYIGDIKTVDVLSNGDDTPVVVNSVEVLTNPVKKSDLLKIKLNLKEASGIDFMQFTFVGTKDGVEQRYWKTIDEDDASTGTFDKTLSFDISDMVGTTYRIEELYIIDLEGNITQYNNYKTDIVVQSDGEENAPVVTGIAMDKTQAILPDKLSLTVNVQDESEITAIGVEFYAEYNGEIIQGTFVGNGVIEKVEDGKYKVDYYIYDNTPQGTYYIGAINVVDSYNNAAYYVNYTDLMENESRAKYLQDEKGFYLHYSNDHSRKCYVYQGQTLVVNNEFDVVVDTSLSNPDLISELSSMEEGKAAKVALKNLMTAEGNNESYICKKEIFETIKGKDKTVIFYHNRYQWIFNGKDITQKTKDVELSIQVSALSYVIGSDNCEEVRVTFAENGVLPGKAKVRVMSDAVTSLCSSAEELYLYYIGADGYDYEENSNIESREIDTGYWCTFEVTHNSKYAITNEEIKDIKVISIALSGISKKIAAGKKVKLATTIYPSYASNQKLTWKCSNKKYATVNNKGVVTTKKKGAGKRVKITAIAKDGSRKKATFTIQIMRDSVKSIKLKAAKSVKAGKSIKIRATVKTTGKKVNKKLKWTTSNSKYATVTSKGVVKTKKAGKGKIVKITAMATDGTGKKKTVHIKIK